MEFKKMAERAVEIKGRYSEKNIAKGEKEWGYAEHAQGLVGDVGDLMRLIMAKQGYRTFDNLDERIRHEIADCLWSVIVIADGLGIDLEKEFLYAMEELDKRVEREKN